MIKFLKKRKYFFSSYNSSYNWGIKKTAPLYTDVFYIKYDNLDNKIMKYKLYKWLYPLFQSATFFFIYDNSFQNSFLNLSLYFYSFIFTNFMFLDQNILAMSLNNKNNQLYFCIYDKKTKYKWILINKESIIFKKANDFYYFEINFEDSEGNIYENKNFHFSKEFNLCKYLDEKKINSIFS